jgi:hypothetical protein
VFPGVCGRRSGSAVGGDRFLTAAMGQTRRVSLLAIATVRFEKAADAELARRRDRPAVSRATSGEAENKALLRPGERQAGTSEQLLRGEVLRVAAFEDRACNVWGEIGQAQNPGEVGACQARNPDKAASILRRVARSPRELVAEHRQAAPRLLARGLVLDHVPVLGQLAVLEAHDIHHDPVRRPA